MADLRPNISQAFGQIRQLDEAAINRIAAGEVVERPASAVKELVENALDAGAKRIDISVADGGKSLIRVEDDGHGIPADELPLALMRHATSKIDGSDLLNIRSFGFRGEALPSLGAVGRLKIASRVAGKDAAEITVAGGVVGAVRPTSHGQGTTVTLRDLFYATPARLKFLRSERAEFQAITDVIKRLAMAEPFVRFTLSDRTAEQDRIVFRADAQTGDLFDALHGRLGQILGKDFAENAVALDAERDGFHLTGYAALPTYSRGAAVAQFVYVNGRPVKDKALLGALRGAYADFLSRDRYPVVALFLDCDPKLVDVNVHPAKTEVRFREPGVVRGLVVSGIRHALAGVGHRASSTVGAAALGAMKPEPHPSASSYRMDRPGGAARAATYQLQAPAFSEPSARFEQTEPAPVEEALPLGAARAQIHENYIIAQTETGMVIVDQHAAHERLVYEKLKAQMAENGVAAQALLIPEVIELSEGEASLLLDHAVTLGRFGLTIESFGGGAVVVRETPAILGEVNAEAIVRDVLDELADLGSSDFVQARIEAILSRVACHGSIRSGRRMSAPEMNALLREMEATPHSGQCNHGRPTYVSLALDDVEKLFGRK